MLPALLYILTLQVSEDVQLSAGLIPGAGSPYAPLTTVIMAQEGAKLIWDVAVTAGVIRL